MKVGRIALVTGGSGGIGGGIAERLASDGFGVAVHGYSGSDRAAAVRDRIRAADGRAESYRADLADEGAVEQLFEAVLGDFGDLDAVVSNAGIFPRSLVVEMSLAEWERVQAVNLRSTFLVCRAAARHLQRRGQGGRIVTIASGSAARGMARGAHYAASKAGIVAFTKSLALELGRDQILVNCVAPGTIDTPMPRQDATEVELLERARTLVPLSRMGTPRDVAQVVAFLLDERLTWLTGQTIWVNGGDLMP
jgi:NAD(P)-dependent dehydrogenase (short-subunit alcohol dehydrogenase family)